MKNRCLFFLALAGLLLSIGPASADTGLDTQTTDTPVSDSFAADSPSAKSAAKEKSVPEYTEGLDPEAALLARISGIFKVEDPTSIYNFDIQDKNVEFVLDGTWETKIESIVNITFNGSTPLLALNPPVFTQTVNLSSWVFINKTWYFESTFAEDFTKNTVAAGYIGNDDTYVKHVRVGNSGIVFPGTYSFVTIGGGTAIAPGVMGTFAGDTWNADAIVRYDTAASRELVLSGMNEISDEYVPVTALVQGKWFILPDAAISGGVTVYEESDSGSYTDSKVSGRKWRKLDSAEFKVYGTEGLLELLTETSGSVAIVYYGNYGSGTTPGANLISFTTETWNWFNAISSKMPSGYLPSPASGTYTADLADRFLLSIGSETALVVRERGKFSPFTLSSRYRADGTEPSAVFSKSDVKPNYLDVTDYDGVYVELYRTDAHAPASIRAPASRFPLSPEFPFLYLPGYGGQKPDTDLSIRSRSYKAITSIALGSDAIAGTILVSRNGINDTAFRFDDASGILTLEKQPTQTEKIRITWLDTDKTSRNATLTLGGGIHWRPTDPLTLSLASALRWNIAKNGYTDASDTSPGSFLLSTGIEYAGDSIKASTAFAFDVSVPDTTGYYRILGMDSDLQTFYPAKTWYKTVEDTISPVLGLPVNSTPVTLDDTDRVPLSGTDGDTLESVSDSSMSGAVLVMSCDLPTTQSWAGAEILTGTNGSTDWENAEAVSVTLRNPGTKDTFDVYLQLGTGASDYYEDAATVRTWKLTTPAAGSNWATQTITLSDSDRTALSSGKNLRLIVIPSSTAVYPLAINLRSGKIVVNGTGFTAVADPEPATYGKLTVQETTDPAATALVTAQPDVIGRFNSGSVNTVALLGFTPETDTNTVTASAHFAEISLSSYNSLSFFIYPEKLPASASSKVIVSLTRPDTSANTIKTALTMEILASALVQGQWQKITVDLGSKKILRDDNEISGANAQVTAIDRDILPTRLAVIFDGWSAPVTAPANSDPPYYSVALDEFYLHDTEPVYTVRNESKFSWKKSGTVVSSGKTAILADPRIALTADSSKSSNVIAPVISGTADGGITLLGVKTEGTITASNTTARVTDSTGYSVDAPIGPASLKEQYYADFTGNDFRRDDAVALSGPVNMGASTHIQLYGRNLVRNTAFNLSPRLPQSRVGNFSLSATSAFSQTGLSPRTDITNAEWGDLWENTVNYSLSTGAADATKRTGKTALHTGWAAPDSSPGTTGLSGITLDTEADSSYSSSTAVALGSSYSYTLAVPFKIGYSTLTPSWYRIASQEKTDIAGGSYITDSDFLCASFNNLSYLYKTPPFVDLFDPDLSSKIRDSGTFSRTFINRYGLAWKRPAFGTVSDLWIPDSVDSSITRNTATDSTVTNIADSWTTTIRCGLSALNIAGTYGVKPLFSWYEQDEISQLYSWNAVWGTSYFTWSIDAWDSVMLFFTGTGTFVMENTFHYDSPDISGSGELYRDSIRAVWKRPGKTSFLRDIVSRWTEQPLTVTREDSATFTITRGTSNNTVTCSVDHVLRTGIGKNGEVSVSGGTGYTRTTDGITTIELSLGVGGKLTY